MYLILRTILLLLAFLWIFPAVELYADGSGAYSFSDEESVHRKAPSRDYSTSIKSTSNTAEDDRYQVALSGPGEHRFDPDTGGRVRFIFTVMDKVKNRQYPVYLDNMTAKVIRIALYRGKLVVIGEESTLNSLITTVIDLASKEEIDTFIGFGTTLSENGRFLTYLKFYPPQTSEPEAMSDLILIYDLDDSADGNRLRGEAAYKNDPSGRLIEVGHPVYPEVNAGKKHYRVWVREESSRHTVIPNGFFWFDHDHKIAFGDQIGDETYLVVVDLSGGLNHPVIQKMGVDLSSMLRLEDRENAALLHEAKQFKLENIQDLKNGKFRIHVSSGVPLQSDQIELPMETSGPAASLQTHESAPSAHLP
jgi:hypothetical protein